MRSRRFFHKKSSKNCPPGGVTVFGQPAATDVSCTSEIPLPEGAAEGLTVFDQTFVKSLRVSISHCNNI